LIIQVFLYLELTIDFSNCFKLTKHLYLSGSMKSIIKLALGLLSLAILIQSCKKDDGPAPVCMITSARQWQTGLDLIYDNTKRISEIKYYSDTSNKDYAEVFRFFYNATGSLSGVNHYFYHGLSDSIAFEYIDKKKIKERQYWTTQDGMWEAFERVYILNLNGYLISDTTYNHKVGTDDNEFTGYECSNYDYDEHWNIIRQDKFYKSGNEYVQEFSYTFEYNDILIPDNSYCIARFNLLQHDGRRSQFILPHRTNLLVKETFASSLYSNWSVNYTFELNEKKYPVKEYSSVTSGIGANSILNFKYQCN
jgi:hypothetical protein